MKNLLSLSLIAALLFSCKEQEIYPPEKPFSDKVLGIYWELKEFTGDKALDLNLDSVKSFDYRAEIGDWQFIGNAIFVDNMIDSVGTHFINIPLVHAHTNYWYYFEAMSMYCIVKVLNDSHDIVIVNRLNMDIYNESSEKYHYVDRISISNDEGIDREISVWYKQNLPQWDYDNKCWLWERVNVKMAYRRGKM